MSAQKKDISKDYLQKMVQHYVNGDHEAAKEFLGMVLTQKANRLFNESSIKEEDNKKEEEVESKKETKKPEAPKKTTDKPEKIEDSSTVLAKIRAKHKEAPDKDAFLKKLAKHAGMESCTAADFGKIAKALHSNGKHKGL